MVRSVHRRWVTLFLAIALMALAPIGASAQTQADVDEARRQKELAEAREDQAYKDYIAVQARLDEAVEAYEALYAEREELEWRIARMEAAVERYSERVIELEESARRILVDAYTNGQQSLVGNAFAAQSIQELVTSSAVMDRAAERELASLDNLEAVSREADRSSAELDIRRADVAANEDAAASIVEEMATLHAEKSDILARASANVRAAIDELNAEIREKAVEDARIARQQAEASASRPGAAGGADPAQTPGFICPVEGGASFIDSWGFPRSGGRRHKGVDMFAPRGTNLIAVADGRLKLSSNSLGGLSSHIYADNGVAK